MRLQNIILAAGLTLLSTPALAINRQAIEECDGVAAVAEAVSVLYQEGNTIFEIREKLGADQGPEWMQRLFYTIHESKVELMSFLEDPGQFPPEIFAESWYITCMDWYRSGQYEGSATKRSYE